MKKKQVAKCLLVCLMGAKIKSNLNTYTNKNGVRCGRISYITLGNEIRKARWYESFFFLNISLMLDLLTVGIHFIFKKSNYAIQFISKKHINWF